jgi:hypothetical protein
MDEDGYLPVQVVNQDDLMVDYEEGSILMQQVKKAGKKDKKGMVVKDTLNTMVT